MTRSPFSITFGSLAKMNVQVAVESQDILGEGPVWSPEERALYWVDIQRKLLQRWETTTNNIRTWKLPTTIGSFALRKKGGCVVALRKSLSLLNLANGKLESLFEIKDENTSIRFNDGKCDRQGRFWAGTMDENDPSKKLGHLFCLENRNSLRTILGNIGISNGVGWSPDNGTFYYTDSIEKTIWAYDFEPDTGNISNKRVFVKIEADYVPDGLTVDSEGFIWSAKWDGWKVVRYAPDGKINTEIQMPVQRPTSCMFGGDDFKKLFITSARIGLIASELEAQPLAGNVFVVNVNIAGLPEPTFID